MNRSIPAVLLALSLVLAGCNGLVLGGKETPRQTLTPAPEPTPKPTPTPVPQLAPGLTGKGVTDAFALAEAHAAILENTSYTVHVNFTIQYVNGTVYRHATTRTQYGPSDSQFYLVTNVSGVRETGGISIWSNGERTLVARIHNNSTTYRVFQNGNLAPPQSSNGWIIRLFSSTETRVIGHSTRNGTTLYRVVATAVTNPAAFNRIRWQNPRNLTLRTLISSRGFVREYHLTYTATRHNSTVHIHKRVRYTDIGNTTIERPPWYDEAIENASTTTPIAAQSDS